MTPWSSILYVYLSIGMLVYRRPGRHKLWPLHLVVAHLLCYARCITIDMFRYIFFST